MTLNPADLAFFMGFSVTGDMGWTTWYTRANGQKVFFPKYLLDGKIKTPARIAARDRWRNAAAAWRALTSAKRQAWTNACKSLSLPATGYNVFLYWQTSGNDAAIHTIERQSGINLIA
jgi:hypothetical protein